MKVILKNVHRGRGDRALFIYAEVYEAETGHLRIAATLDYILNAVAEREWALVVYPNDMKTFVEAIKKD